MHNQHFFALGPVGALDVVVVGSVLRGTRRIDPLPEALNAGLLIPRPCHTSSGRRRVRKRVYNEIKHPRGQTPDDGQRAVHPKLISCW